MARTLPVAYLNGAWLPVGEARISPLDRGFLFADAAYEVIAVYGGRALLAAEHIARLQRNLDELAIRVPLDAAAWLALVGGLISRNGPDQDMGLYLHASRGADQGRDPSFPEGVTPTVFAMASPLAATRLDTPGVRAITGPDLRWGRCDIKSTALLANVLARQAATRAGAGECILLRDGYVTEGSSSTVLVLEGDTLLTRPHGRDVLPGITVGLVREVALGCGLGYREDNISESRLRAADEVWLTATLRGVAPVTHIDGQPIGSGRPGPAWRRVATAYERRKRS